MKSDTDALVCNDQSPGAPPQWSDMCCVRSPQFEMCTRCILFLLWAALMQFKKVKVLK